MSASEEVESVIADILTDDAFKEKLKRFIAFVLQNAEDESEDYEGDKWTTLRIYKGDKKRFNLIKDALRDVTGMRIPIAVVVRMFLFLGEEHKLIRMMSVGVVSKRLKAELGYINNIRFVLKSIKDILHSTIPKDKLDEWIRCICEQKNTTYNTFVNLVKDNPTCYDYNDILVIYRLSEIWHEKGEITGKRKKNIIKWATRYLIYSDMLKTALKARTDYDLGKFNLGELSEGSNE